MIFGIAEPAITAFLSGALTGLLWCALGLGAGWLMFRAPLGRRNFRSCVRIDAPHEKIWSSFLLDPSPAGGWGGAVEISAQSFEGDPPLRHRALVRHGGIGPFQESVWRIREVAPHSLFHAEQESLGGVALQEREASVLTFRLTPGEKGTVLVEHEMLRLVRGVFGFLYVPRANRLALEHLRRHCEGREATAAAPVVSRGASLALGGAAFALIVALAWLGNPDALGVAVFVGFFLQLALWTHEFGHLIAMRWFGHKDATLVMVPLFGGVTIGARQPKTEFEQAIVALMGPAFSVALVLALTPFVPLGLDYFHTPDVPVAAKTWFGLGVIVFVAMAIPINLYNMIPIGMLDGGRAIAVLGVGRAMRTILALCVFLALGYAISGSGRENDLGVAVAFVSMAWASALIAGGKAGLQLAPMNRRERFAALALLVVTLAIHIDASRSLLPGLLDAMRAGLVGETSHIGT